MGKSTDAQGKTSLRVADQLSKAKSRLAQIGNFVSGNKTVIAIPWDPDCTRFPARKDLPRNEDEPEGA